MAITIDASTPAGVSSGSNDPWTSASFTPPAGALLVVAVMADAFNITAPTITLTSTGIAFTERIRRDAADAGSNNGYAGIFTGVTPDATARTVAGSTNESADSGAVRVWVLNGADTSSPADATAEGSSNTNNLTANISTVTDGAWVFGCATDWQSLGSPTSTDVGNGWDDADLSGIAVRKSAVTSPAGSVSLNFDAAAGTPDWNWVALAVKPAGGAGTQTVATNALAVGSTIFAPDVVPGAVAIATQAVIAASTVFAPSVRYIVQTVDIDVPSTVFSPSIAVGTVNIAVDTLSVPSTVFNPVVVGSGAVSPLQLNIPSTVFSPTVLRLLEIIQAQLLQAPSTVFSPLVSGGDGGPAMALASIADTARVNMLAELVVSEPQLLSNVDLMNLVRQDVGQTLITLVPEWTPAKQYWEYLKVVRDA